MFCTFFFVFTSRAIQVLPFPLYSKLIPACFTDFGFLCSFLCIFASRAIPVVSLLRYGKLMSTFFANSKVA
nr:MAG TPA: hypothetical protein [Caudoviricetes sp.]